MGKEAKEICEMNIFEKVAGITAELGKLEKDLTVEYGNTKYKGIGEGNVLENIKPLEEKYRVYSYAYDREIVSSEIAEFKTGGKVRTCHFMVIKTSFEFVNLDDPKDRIKTAVFGVGIDSADKSAGKAITYSDKYALLKAYKIETGDDPDKINSDEYGTRERYNRTEKKASSTPETEKTSRKTSAEPSLDKTLGSIPAKAQNTLADFADTEFVQKSLKFYKCESITQLSELQAAKIIKRLNEEIIAGKLK